MQLDFKVILVMLSCVLFIGGLAAKPSRTNLLWYVIGVGCLAFVLIGCTECSNWFQGMSGSTLGYIPIFR
jgi:hypothetical protein